MKDKVFHSVTKCGARCDSWSQDSADLMRDSHEKYCPRCELEVVKPKLARRTEALTNLLWSLEVQGSIPTRVIQAAKDTLKDG